VKPHPLLLPATLLLAMQSAGCDTACQAGDLCDWFGNGEAAATPDGLDRLDASTFWVVDVVFDPADDHPYVLDWNNHRIVSVEDDGSTRTITGTAGVLGDGPEGPMATATWNHPTDLAFRSDGTMLLAAWHNSRIVSFDLVAGTASFVAGTGARDFGGDGGPGLEAKFDLPCGVVVDGEDNIYVADMANQRIRVVANDVTHTVNTVAGDGQHGFDGDGPALQHSLASPGFQRAEPAFKMDFADGKVYLADTHNGRVRTIDIATGVLTTIAGIGETADGSAFGTNCTSGCGYGGDGGPAIDAMLNYPTDVDVAPDGTVYIADTYNHCVRAIDADGTIRTAAGVCGEAGYDGAWGPATDALLDHPFGVETDSLGNLYVSDTYNHRIRLVPVADVE
jgi:hypothetical protein